jgi:uncharacterized DUF497 family protein
MALNITFSIAVLEKLRHKHKVNVRDVEQCFENRIGGLLTDTRAEHKTVPPTCWFIAETNMGRTLKIVYIQNTDGRVFVKSAYEPNSEEMRIYEKYS